MQMQVSGLFVTLGDQKNTIMGRGDKKTKKGKIFKGSFGKSRPAKPARKSGAKAPAAAEGGAAAAPKGK
jgi:30S ribosomal protein S31